MAKEFIYTKAKEIGKLEENTTVEIGHYKVDGKDMPDKVYLVSHFTRRNGTEEDKQKMAISDSFVTGFAIFVIAFGLIMLKICWI